MNRDREKELLNPAINHRQVARETLHKVCQEIINERGSIRDKLFALFWEVRVEMWKAEEVLPQETVNSIISQYDRIKKGT